MASNFNMANMRVKFIYIEREIGQAPKQLKRCLPDF